MTTAEHPLVPQIRQALHRVEDPEIRRPITDLGMVDDIAVDAEGRSRVRVLLTVAGCPLRDTLRRDVTAAVVAVPGVTAVEVDLGVMSDEQRGALRMCSRVDRRTERFRSRGQIPLPRSSPLPPARAASESHRSR
jgi:ATP-binding protein involved in chromosome partitioning